MIGDFTAKLIAGLLILVCLFVGAVGLIIPIIPGLLFLAIAALIVAKHSSRVESWLRKNRAMNGYLDSADGFLDLPFRDKVQYTAWLCLKMLIDGAAFCVNVVARLIKLGGARYRPTP